MQFYEINICQVMIFRLYTLFITSLASYKLEMELEKYRKYYRKCSISFAADSNPNLSLFVFEEFSIAEDIFNVFIF